MHPKAARRASLLLAALLSLLTSAGRAQIIRPNVVSRPAVVTSVAIGWLQQQYICDPDSGACWNFGSAPQYRASFEMPMGEATSVGFSVATSRVPLVWATQSPSQLIDADATLNQYFALVHMGAAGRIGFQQLLDVSLGAATFSNFRSTAGTTLGSGKTVTDISFALAYGFGYGMSSRLSLFVQQEFGLIMHKRSPGTPNNSAQQQTLRFGARLGLW